VPKGSVKIRRANKNARFPKKNTSTSFFFGGGMALAYLGY